MEFGILGKVKEVLIEKGLSFLFEKIFSRIRRGKAILGKPSSITQQAKSLAFESVQRRVETVERAIQTAQYASWPFVWMKEREADEALEILEERLPDLSPYEKEWLKVKLENCREKAAVTPHFGFIRWKIEKILKNLRS